MVVGMLSIPAPRCHMTFLMIILVHLQCKHHVSSVCKYINMACFEVQQAEKG